MEEGEGQDLATTVLTCEGDLRDPGFPGRLQSLVLRLRELISDEEQPLWVKKVEPWNSVRVTFTLPRDAALRLRQLAQRGDQALRELGILSVQVEGDQIISLTLAGRYGEPPKEIIIQKAAEEGEQDPAASAVVSGAAASSVAAGPSSSRAGSSSSSSSTTVPAEPASIPRNPAFAAVAAASTSSGSGFRSPNVVAPPPREPLPFLSSGSSRFVRPATKTRPPFPFASMTHSMKQNSAAAAATSSGSRFPFSPSPPLAAALGAAAQRMGGASRGNVALSSPLLVNLLQSETGSGPQKLMMPPPLDTGQPTKRKRRPPKGSRGKEGASPPGSPSPPPPTSPSCDAAASVLGSRGYPLSHIPLSPPRTAPPSSTVSVAPPSPPTTAESRATTHLINPFTGHLEPMPSDEEDDEPAVRDLETSESSENGGHSERSLSDGSSGKDPGNPSSDTDSGIGKSCSSQSPNEPEPPVREEVSRVSLPPTEGELKLRLKIDSKRSGPPVKALDVEASPPPSPQGEPPRVPPLHISLRGPNVAVVVSPRKPEAAAAAPKKRSPRSPRSSNADSEARRGCRGARARGDKAAERLRELSLLSGGGIVRVPVSMSPTVVLTPLQLQHPLGPTRRTLPGASPSSSSSSSSPSSSSPSSASSSCAQSTKPHWSATSLGPEADSSVSDGSSPLRDRPDLPHALRSADHDAGGAATPATMTSTTVVTPLLQAGNGEPAANSALGALECHAVMPHRTTAVTARPTGSVSTPETNGVLHPDDPEDAARHSPSPCRTSPSPAAKTATSAIEKKNPLTGCLEGGTNHIGSTDPIEDTREVAERRLSPPMARIISLDTVTAKKAAFSPVFEVSDVDVPAALKLGGLVGGNHRMPLLIPTGGGGAAFRGDVVVRQEYATAAHHHFHCTTTANSVLKPGIVRMNRLRFGTSAGFAAAATQSRVETAANVMVKTNGIAASPPQNECDSTMDAESSLDSDDLVTNGLTSTTPTPVSLSVACVTSQTLSATSAIVSRSDGFSSDLPASRGVCDSASNGNVEFAAVASSDNGVTTTGRAEESGDSVSPDSNHERLPRDRLDPGDTDGDKNGDVEAGSALSEGRGSSVLPPSEDPCSNIPPDRPSSAPPPSTATFPPPSSTPEPAVVASSQSTASSLSETAPSPLVAGTPVAGAASPPRPSSSPATWDCAPTDVATAAPPRTNSQPSDGGAVDVPSSTMQVPGGRMISPSKWSGDPQQRLTFILKGSLSTGASSSSSSSASTHPVLALPAGGNAAKPVPIKVLSLPSGASSLALKSSSLAELMSPPTQAATSGSVSPPIRLVVSKVAPVKAGAVGGATAATATASSPSSLVNAVTKSVMVAGASLNAATSAAGEEAPTSTLPFAAPSSEAALSPPTSAASSELFTSGACEVPVVETPARPRSLEQVVCAVVTPTPSVVVTEADTRAASLGAASEVGECGAEDLTLSAVERPATPAGCVTTGGGELAARLSPPLAPAEVMANHVGSPQLPDSLSSLLDIASEPPEDDESEAASGHGSPLPEPLVLVNHREDEEVAREHLVDLELLRSCSTVCAPPDDLGETGRLRNQRRRVTQVLSPVLAEGDEEEAATPLLAASPSDHSSEEDLSLSELAHKSRVRQPPPPPPPPTRPLRQGGKENEALAALDSPAPTTRREDGGPGRPRRLTAGGVEASKVAARLRLGQQQQQQPAVPPSQQPQAPAHLPPLGTPVAPLPAEEALRRTAADRSRRSPATTPASRDHRSPPRQPNQRNFRRDSEVRDDDAVVVMKRKTRASGPSTDPQQEAAAPNKRRRYSKDSHR